MFRLAVLASGRGSNFNAIVQACARGAIPARVVGLFSLGLEPEPSEPFEP